MALPCRDSDDGDSQLKWALLTLALHDTSASRSTPGDQYQVLCTLEPKQLRDKKTYIKEKRREERGGEEMRGEETRRGEERRAAAMAL